MNLERYYSKLIAYDSLTYGQIHNIVIERGIQMCVDFKLQNKFRKENMINKREMDTFLPTIWDGKSA